MKSVTKQIKQVYKDIFKIEILLPDTPLKSINNYFIRGSERNLWIDTAFNYPKCRESIVEAIVDLGVDMTKTDIFLTHKHEDHCALIDFIATKSSEIISSAPTIKMLRTGESSLSEQDMHAFLKRNVPLYDQFAQDFKPWNELSMRNPLQLSFRTVKHGDTITVGQYTFSVIETPGHAEGHLCLYERNNGILISGDHILGTIFPNLLLWTESNDIIEEYLTSLDRIELLKIDLVLPGHRNTLIDCRQRIEKIRNFQERRSEEVLKIVKFDEDCNGLNHESAGLFTAYDVAVKMRWSVMNNNFDDFTFEQKVLFISEVSAHLHHLHLLNYLQKEVKGDLIYYFA